MSTLRDVPYPVQVVWGADDPALTLGRPRRAGPQRAAGIERVHAVPAKHFLQEDQAPPLWPSTSRSSQPPGSGEPAKKKNQTARARVAVDTLSTITTSSTLCSWRESSSPRMERCQGMRTRTDDPTPTSRP